jgi:hypothetical protein
MATMKRLENVETTMCATILEVHEVRGYALS